MKSLETSIGSADLGEYLEQMDQRRRKQRDSDQRCEDLGYTEVVPAAGSTDIHAEYEGRRQGRGNIC